MSAQLRQTQEARAVPGDRAAGLNAPPLPTSPTRVTIRPSLTSSAPAPGHTILVAAALAAAYGRLDIRLVLLAGAVGTLLGSHTGWIIGRRAGGGVRRRSGPAMVQLAKMERTFARWGGFVVVFGPFVEGIRQLNALAAGALAMPWPRFALWNLAGTVLWTAIWGGGTWLLGENIEGVLGIAERVRPWLLAVSAASVAAGLALLVLRRRPT